MTPHDGHLADEMLQQAHMLRALARTLVRGADADDLVQETWLRALERAPGQAGSLGGWLRTVCTRLFLAERRTHIRREQRERLAASAEALPWTSDLVEHRAALLAVTEAVAGLTDGDYEVIRLRFYEDLKPARIAEHLGLPLDTVKRRLERALGRLRQKLTDEHGPSWHRLLVPLGAWPAASSSSLIPLAFAGAIMAKKSLVVVAALALLVGGTSYFTLRSQDPSVTRPRTVAAAQPLDATTTEGRGVAGSEREEVAATLAIARATTGATGSLLVELARSDGSPAAGAVGRVELSRASQLVERSDADGRLRFPALSPGRAFVRVYPSGHGEAEVISGEEARLRITIPAGANLEGRVLARDGSPVGGAEVSLGMNPWERIVITSSDQEGRFQIRDYWSGFKVDAVAPGHAPSATYYLLRGEPGQTVSVTIEMGGTAGAIRGRVLGIDDTPISSAQVVVAPDEAQPTYRMGTMSPPVRHVATDALGAFEIAGVASGKTPIMICARGHGPWNGTVEVEAGAVATLVASLPPQGELTGVVVDRAGSPVGGASVAVAWKDEQEWYFNHFREANAVTEEDGFFHLDSLPRGAVQGKASKEHAGRATADLVIGAETTWEPVLDPGHVLRGRVVDERGVGIPKCLVITGNVGPEESSRGAASWPQDRTDAEGRFVLTNCPEARCQVKVTNRELLPERKWLALLPDVPTDGPELTIQIDERTRPSARITGFVREGSGAPAPSEVGLYSDAIGHPRQVGAVDPGTGAFQIGSLAAGKYEIEVKRLPLGRLERVTVELEHGAQHDLGAIVLPAAGTLRVVFEGRERIEGRVLVSIGQPFPGSSYHTLELDDAKLSDALELLPGKYGISVQGAAIVPREQAFEIASGRETVLTIPLQRGQVTRFSFRLTPEDLESEQVSGTITTVEGAEAASVGASRGSGFRSEIVLAPGQYRLSATATDSKPPTRHVTASGVVYLVGSPPRYQAAVWFEVSEGSEDIVHEVELTPVR